LHAVLPFQTHWKNILEVSTRMRPEIPISFTISQSLVLVLLKMALSTGLSETHGDPIGENKVSSELLEESTTSLLRLTVLGVLQKIHGPMMKDITPLKLRKMTH